MKTPDFVYVYGEKQYNVFLSKNFQRNIYFRFKEDGFHISAPHMTSRATIIKGLDKYAGKLIRQYVNTNSNYSLEENFVYLLGEKYEISSLNIKNIEELQVFLKKTAKQVITELVRENEQIMGISKPYKVSIRNTTSRYGSNSKQTHGLSFQLNLIHYSKEIINSVVVHELAHDFERNHQKEFYNIVYKYCPNYDAIQKKLKKGIHK